MEIQERLSEKVKVNFTEADLVQLKREARARNMPLGPCVRAIVNDYLRTQLTRGETILLAAIAETKANHVDVIRLSLERKLSPDSLDELVEQNRLRRRELAHEFLLTVAASTDLPEDDEDEDEGEDEGDE